MNRDGAQTSLWQDKTGSYSARAVALPQEVVDVLIVGGGITGITTGLLLQKAGQSCLVAESHNICFGTTGGTTAHLNTVLDTSYTNIIKDFGELDAQLVAGAAKDALALFKRHVLEYNIDCGYEEKDGFVYSQDDKQTKELEDMYRDSKKAGVEVEYTDSIPVPVPFQKALVYRHQAQIHPARYVYALAAEFEKAGGILMQGCRVGHKVEETAGVLITDSNLGTIRARNIIYATHIPPGVNLLHFRCAPYRSYAMAVKLKDDNYPNGLAYDMQEPYHYHRTQVIDGERYLIVGGEDHKTAHQEHTETCFGHLGAYIQKHYAVDSIPFRWSSQYFEPSDGLAYIGKLPGAPDHVYVATGYSGNGITYSHIAAITLSDLIVRGDSDFKEVFDPRRAKPAAEFTRFIKENVDVVKEFVARRFEAQKIKGLVDLAPGEGRLVKFEGHNLALYKDEQGGIHALDPVCPHAYCMVGWNSAEKSWDCPCHGSRFSVDGEVLTGPTHTNLQKIHLL
jgi:glycine/D-amino acid oxidase-like deaminating enzyme/nitrite reductase/ring-hydroxylating ferredoxin subunit